MVSTSSTYTALHSALANVSTLKRGFTCENTNTVYTLSNKLTNSNNKYTSAIFRSHSRQAPQGFRGFMSLPFNPNRVRTHNTIHNIQQQLYCEECRLTLLAPPPNGISSRSWAGPRIRHWAFLKNKQKINTNPSTEQQV